MEQAAPEVVIDLYPNVQVKRWKDLEFDNPKYYATVELGSSWPVCQRPIVHTADLKLTKLIDPFDRANQLFTLAVDYDRHERDWVRDSAVSTFVGPLLDLPENPTYLVDWEFDLVYTEGNSWADKLIAVSEEYGKSLPKEDFEHWYFLCVVTTLEDIFIHSIGDFPEWKSVHFWSPWEGGLLHSAQKQAWARAYIAWETTIDRRHQVKFGRTETWRRLGLEEKFNLFPEMQNNTGPLIPEEEELRIEPLTWDEMRDCINNIPYLYYLFPPRHWTPTVLTIPNQ
jgi:hypothetical protein